ncbi:c-type cytochrome [Alteraurantiacibacter aquimixticola]|uniref:Cytochrome c n=1 Tax=Alteraurantiacibacter aquimixticola TaxID=2489173 RepID=A0A4T3F7J2_9SPHN|nr:cytochrome c [Alteraurantiacibacter aquimixticola]TIX50950.1 cytochrome c [Alteraurantiacibacter aquimixticola]
MRLLLASAALLAAGVGAVAAQDAVRTGPAAPELAEGKAVYAHWCAPCHAAEPSLPGTMSLAAKYDGSDIPAALEDRTDLSAPVIGVFVRNGVAWMPPFRPTEISDAELAQLSAYLTAPLEDRGAHTPLLADEMVQLHGGSSE